MSCELASINRNYPWSSPVTVMTSVIDANGNKTELPYTIQSGSTVKSAILDRTGQTILAGPVIANEADAGSAWLNGVVVVTFALLDIHSLPTGKLILLVEVDDGFEAAYKGYVQVEDGVNI